MAAKKAPITETQKTAAEEQIRALRKEIDYNTRDYSIDFLIQQFRNDEFYIPDEYQRQYIWNDSDKTKFINKIILLLIICKLIFIFILIFYLYLANLLIRFMPNNFFKIILLFSIINITCFLFRNNFLIIMLTLFLLYSLKL